MYPVKKIQKILSCKRGETLIEGITSIFVFVVLIASISMMIMMSMRITSNATLAAEIMQEEAGEVLAGSTAGGPEDNGDVVFESDELAQITINVDIYINGGFIAFQPVGP